MKVALVLPHFYPYVGGAETMFYEVAKGLIAAGHEVRVVARNVGDEYLGRKEVEGMDITYCPWKSAFGHPFPRFKDIEPLIEWCDVVHTSIFTTAPVVSLLAARHKKPCLLTVYEVRGSKWFWSDKWYKALVYLAVEQFACRQRFDAYHAISEATKRDFIKFIGHRDIRRVYLSDSEPEEAAEDFSVRKYFNIGDEKLILYFGRPGRTKGVFVYEEAISILKKRGEDLGKVRFCFLLGKEPEAPRKELLSKMRADGLKGIVRIRPSVSRPELAACIAGADCVVVPSLTEGFGFSALETCRKGIPLIYSDGGSLPEVAYGKCRSFRNRDAKDLADKLSGFIRGEDIFENREEKSFTTEAMINGILDIYEDIK